MLPPEKTGQARTRSVLRRFSHFLKLHGKVGAGLASHACLDASLCITCNVMHKLATKSITCQEEHTLTLCDPTDDMQLHQETLQDSYMS